MPVTETEHVSDRRNLRNRATVVNEGFSWGQYGPLSESWIDQMAPPVQNHIMNSRKQKLTVEG